MDSTRVDRWLWAVRLFPTRPAAADACRAGHVRVGGARVKPAAPVRVGDRIEARVHDRERVVEVRQIIERRVAATVAEQCLVDHSPPPPPPATMPPIAPRERGAGRPTGRDRRQLDRARNPRPR